MSGGLAILLERDNVNDDVVILTKWFAKNGERVEEGTLIAEVETSKANVEVTAPKSGYLKWEFEEKTDMPYEAPLGWIFDEPIPAGDLVIAGGTRQAVQAAEPEMVSAAVAPAPPPVTQALATESVPTAFVFSASSGYGQQFSRRARELMREHGLGE